MLRTAQEKMEVRLQQVQHEAEEKLARVTQLRGAWDQEIQAANNNLLQAQQDTLQKDKDFKKTNKANLEQHQALANRFNDQKEFNDQLKQKLQQCKNELALTVDQVAEAKMTATKSLLEAEKRQESALYAQECEFRKKLELVEQQLKDQDHTQEEHKDVVGAQRTRISAQAEEFSAQVESICDLMSVSMVQEDPHDRVAKEQLEELEEQNKTALLAAVEKATNTANKASHEKLKEKDHLIDQLELNILDQKNQLLAQATALAQQQEQWAAWEEAEHEERLEERVALTNTLQQQIKEEYIKNLRIKQRLTKLNHNKQRLTKRNHKTLTIW